MNMSFPSPSLLQNPLLAPKYICFGHSHLSSVIRAYPAFSGSRKDVPPMSFVQLQDPAYLYGYKGEDRNKKVAQRLAERIVTESDGGAPVLFAFVGGPEIYRLSFVEHPRPFDFFYAPAQHLPFQEGAEIIPCRVIEDIITAALRGYIDFFNELTELVPARITLVSSPPPVADNGFFLRKANPHHDRMMQEKVPPPVLRYKIWHLRNKIFEKMMKEKGVTFIWPAKQCLDGNGFLNEKFASFDGLHARKIYGQHVLAQIVNHIKNANRPLGAPEGARKPGPPRPAGKISAAAAGGRKPAPPAGPRAKPRVPASGAGVPKNIWSGEEP